MNVRSFALAPAAPSDVPDILELIRGLAEYERLAHLCVSTERDIQAALFGPRPSAEVVIVRRTGESREAVAFALFFQTFSTFLGRPGLWLEDLFVRPYCRGEGIGKALLRRLAAIARERDCGRFEWSVLDWNASAIGFYESLGAKVMSDWRICRVTGDALVALGREPAVEA